MKSFRIPGWIKALAAAASGAWWWYYGRGIEVSATAPARGTAVEIGYATGTVEPPGRLE